MADENGNKTFVRITNKMIYDKIECLDRKVGTVINDAEQNAKDIRLNKKSIWWLITSISIIALSIIGWALQSGISG